ncbi:MAG: type II secretion system F family protein [Ilumatobacteraceae bacterium]
MSRLLPLATWVSWFWWLAPRMWFAADRHVARRRLVAPSSPSTHTERFQSAAPRRVAALTELSAVARDTARSLRTGEVPGAALARSLRHHCIHSHHMSALADDLDRPTPLSDALASALSRFATTRPRHDVDPERRFVSLLAAGTIDGVLLPSTTDRTADVLDDLAARVGDVRVAAAHARLTMRFLTVLPLGVGALACVTSQSLRSSWNHPGVLVPVAVGAVLHVIGRATVARTVAAVHDSAHEPVASASRIADTVSASLTAGLTPAAAVARLDIDPDCGEVASRVAAAVRAGVPLSRALEPFVSEPHLRAVAEMLLAAAQQGAGGAKAAAQLADMSRRQRAERTRVAVAALPGRLSVPVTLFVLPSFLVGVLVPVVATGARLA